tara:strand:+ start:55 stop:513 length:459 start_codon:yes stop_codon:yes gene_type:complete
MMKRIQKFQLIVVGALLFFAGCGSGTDEWVEARETVYPASGVVTLDGQPVKGATVIFHSVRKSISAQGMTDEDGRYYVTTYEDNDGAVAGKHVVTVRKSEYVQKKTKHHTEEEPSYYKVATEILPAEFATEKTSTLEVTVPESGADDLDFKF